MRRERDYDAAFAEGRRLRGALLLVVARPNDLPYPRLGVSVGRRVARGAVQRNRLKRLVREAFRLNRERLPAGFDLVVCPQRTDRPLALRAIAEELVALATRLGPARGTKAP